MSTRELIVLKFGGSVLADEASLRRAVHEVYRWKRRGDSVVAVVSALSGATETLLEKSRTFGDSPAPEAVAAFVSTGERYSAALLNLHLDRCGIPSKVLTPAAVNLVAEGDPLDASPTGLDASRIHAALDEGRVVVMPGFVAHDHSGHPVVLGRGGSDLTALFLADHLAATRCVLVKDVDGLYESDPAAGGPAPKRYARATWDDALATDGSIVQHKAVHFAREHELEFELGRFNGTRPTRVGRGPTRFESGGERVAPLRVALLGLGTVGTGVCELLRQLPEQFELVSTAVREPAKDRAVALPPELLTGNVLEAASSGADVVVELIGGLEEAREAIEVALRAGSHVVTANKRVIAKYGEPLRSLAGRGGRTIRYSAAVGGSTPVLERLAHRSPSSVRSLRGILNGTTNFILGLLGPDTSLDEAIGQARARGLAELDSSRDLLGLDAADKLRVIARELDLHLPDTPDIPRDPLSAESTRRCRNGAIFRHVASLYARNGSSSAGVLLTELDPADPLARASGEQNVVQIEYHDGTSEIVRGKGAGRWPTAEAVVADLLELSRSLSGRGEEELARLEIREHGYRSRP